MKKTAAKSLNSNKKAWVVTVNMGYGHQRTAYPLKNLAFNKEIINANSYKGIPQKDRRIWETTRKSYEFISNFKRVPLVGKYVFSIFDGFQKILNFYPKRDLSQPSFSLKQTFNLIKKGWGRHLVEKLKENPAPLISTFFIPAFMAEFFNYPGKIYCIICDADISRSWVSLKPSLSRIQYFAPNERVVERLKLYGVKPENIFLTGYPLPLENISDALPSGGHIDGLEILKNDIAHRILNLDPEKKYRLRYQSLIEQYVGKLPEKSNHPLTLMFAVGGAGVQKEIGIALVRSLAKKIKARKIKIILVAGIKKKVKQYFKRNLKKLNLETFTRDHTQGQTSGSSGVEIIFEKDIKDYFQKFNQALRMTDILYTKPSELSFYTALGMPIIIAPSVGSQEDFNQEWLLRLGSAMLQKNPKHTDQWLFDLLNDGWFAEAAMQGFIEGEKLGTLNIQKIISTE